MEDRELQERYWTAGGRCWFNPEIVVYAEVQRFRLEKDYHRRWHFRFGELQALLRKRDFERSGRHVLGVPGHVLRRFAIHESAFLADTIRGRKDSAFEHDLEARFYAGFLKMRWKSLLSGNKV